MRSSGEFMRAAVRRAHRTTWYGFGFVLIFLEGSQRHVLRTTGVYVGGDSSDSILVDERLVRDAR